MTKRRIYLIGLLLVLTWIVPRLILRVLADVSPPPLYDRPLEEGDAGRYMSRYMFAVFVGELLGFVAGVLTLTYLKIKADKAVLSMALAMLVSFLVGTTIWMVLL